VQLNVTFSRIVVFAGLFVAFLAWACPSVPNVRGVGRAFGYVLVVFIAGAFLFCFGDFQFGLFPRKSLRAFFIIAGAALMILSIALVHSWSATSNQALQPTATRFVYSYFRD